MFDHVTIRVSDREASDRFYDTVLPVLGKRRYDDGSYSEWGDLSIVPDDAPVAERLHMAFYAETHDLVDAFHKAGVDAGFRSDGAPGPRDYIPSYYGAFLLDPDGNSVEAVSLDKKRTPGQLDHLWLRTTNLDAVSAFYETIAPTVGIEVERRGPERTYIHNATGSFSFVVGEPPTRHVHLAFPVDTNEGVDAFHATATAAGYEDNGAPGERPIYHPGYYGAFVLDPDGHNIEAVNHNR
ncbi:VOC family protein [Solirubrobacter ginsenosidimutans]|uniref:VOC family protein n=1 Tax=Solirubrobacter ginsenosidimutans TaxID=490573 RepID=A0A9X3S5U0_9ACTN|nr:VOC family protein [Solirubrobacter ginsenosidimutans]MDA0164506.1 VOC family protein [Solirubrobacter ginsenosidimutans]